MLPERAIVLPEELKPLRLEVSKGLTWVKRFSAKVPEEMDTVAGAKELALAWTLQLGEAGVKPENAFEAFRRHVNRSKYWPTPAEVIEIAKALQADRRVLEVDTRSALPANTEPPTLEEIEARRRVLDEIVGGMAEGPRGFFLDVIGQARKERDQVRGQAKRQRGRLPLQDIDVSEVITDDDLRRRDEQIHAMRRDSA